jgi:hypothetical protein
MVVVEGTVERMASQWVEAAASQEAAWVVILELVVHLPAARQVVLSAATMSMVAMAHLRIVDHTQEVHLVEALVAWVALPKACRTSTTLVSFPAQWVATWAALWAAISWVDR